MTQDLLTEVAGGVATITFNRPQARNAVTIDMLLGMRDFLQTIEHDRAVRCIVLTGAGDHFQAGGDVTGFSQVLTQSNAERQALFGPRILRSAPLFLQLEKMPQPIIAKVRGAAAGASLGLVAGADFAVSAASAVFILAHVKIGASPDGSSSYYLPRVLGARKAKELAIFGDKVDAPEALRIGLVTHVVPDAELDTKVADMVRRIVAAPDESVRRAKWLMDRAGRNTLEQQLQLEAEAFAACAGTDNFKEGVSAFVDKRTAVFNKKS